MDFIHDIDEIARADLNLLGFPLKEDLTTHQVLLKYLNVLNKTISPSSRSVEKSEKVVNLSLSDEYREALTKIEEAFENGENVNCFLSKKSLNPNEPDGLLDDWKLHHLHLSVKKTKDPYFVDRSDYLLFVWVEDTTARFVDVRKHGEKSIWGKEDFIETLESNWPNLLAPYKLNNVLGVSKEFTPEERIKLRSNGINTIDFVNGAAYIPMGGGVSTANTNVNHTRNADALIASAQRMQSLIEEQLDSIKAQIVEKTNKTNAGFNFKLIRLENEFRVIEEHSGILIGEALSP